MKRIVIAALVLGLLFAAALAEGSIKIEVEGRALTLEFDPSEEYSTVANGLARASFYTYGDQPNRLYEVTLIFPADVRGGDVIDTRYALSHNPECSVVALFSSDTETLYYFAGVVDGVAYPNNSSFAITFDSVTDTDGGQVYSGHVTASLVGMDMLSESGLRYYQIDAAPFSFTMPAANHIGDSGDDIDGYNPFDAEPGGDALPAAPEPSPTPEVRRV